MAGTKYLKKRLSDFPAGITENILFFLPAATIQEPLLVVDDLRPFIIDKYFTQEIQLNLEPKSGARWFGAETIMDTFDVNQIGGIERIERFLVNNTSIVPHKYVVIPDKENRLLYKFLQRFRDVLSRAPRLEIKFPSPNPGMNEVFFLTDMYSSSTPDTDKELCISAELMDLIYSFPNIYLLEAWSKHQLTSSIPPPASIKRFKLEGLDLLDWLNVSFPRNLTHLDICMTCLFDGFILGANVTNDLLSQLLGAELPVKIATKYPTCNNFLVSLCVTNCRLNSLDLSILPPTLEHLEYLSNGFLTVDENSKNLSWPKGLKHLSLTNNNIDDDTLQKLSVLGWPCHLEELSLVNNLFQCLENITGLPQTLTTLRLGDNQFTTLDGLKGLPSSLKVLDLTRSHSLETLNVPHGPGEYPYFKFPESLQTLLLSHCNWLSWGAYRVSTSIPISQRIHFPRSLEHLNLESTNLTSLAYFVFPESLKTLELYFNGIQDLRSYNLRSGSEGSVSWAQLANLRKLDLSYNKLRTLEGWVPPRLLWSLRLSNNEISCSDTKAIPLFNRRFHTYTDNLRELYLVGANIDASDPDFYLPQNLTVLDLSSNKSFRFESFSSLSRHNNIVELSLANNGIREIGPPWQLPPNLRNLVLSSNKISMPEYIQSLASHGHLEVLHLGENMIQRIDPSWKLPPNLKSLDLNGNSILAFEFTHSFASHGNLIHLDLSNNPLRKISLRHPERQYSSLLKFLDLSSLSPRDSKLISAAGLYCLLELMGVKVINKHRDISREHRFA